MALLLLIYCLTYFPLFVGVLCLSLICFALLYVQSSFAIILKRKRILFALLLLSYRCLVNVNVLWLFLTVPWVGLQCMIVVFPDHAHFLFENRYFVTLALTIRYELLIHFGLITANSRYFTLFIHIIYFLIVFYNSYQYWSKI